MNTWKGKRANKDESAAKKWKVITLEVQFESNVNEVVKELTDPGYTVTATTREDTMELSEGELTQADEEMA